MYRLIGQRWVKERKNEGDTLLLGEAHLIIRRFLFLRRGLRPFPYPSSIKLLTIWNMFFINGRKNSRHHQNQNQFMKKSKFILKKIRLMTASSHRIKK